MRKYLLLVMLAALAMYFKVNYALTPHTMTLIYKQLINENGWTYHPQLNLILDDDMNAYYDKQENSINVNSGMLKRVRNVDEMAWILAHEVSHNRTHQGNTFSTEMQADDWGQFYSIRAGFNGCKGVKIIKRFQAANDGAHPLPSIRYKAVECKHANTN